MRSSYCYRPTKTVRMGAPQGMAEHLRAAEHRNPGHTLYGHAAETIDELCGHAEFLCARIRELEGELTGDGEASRQYFGHVLPAVARMESALAEARGNQ